MVVILPYCIKAKRCEHNALGYWSGLALCLTKVRSSRARCPATALIVHVLAKLGKYTYKFGLILGMFQVNWELFQSIWKTFGTGNWTQFEAYFGWHHILRSPITCPQHFYMNISVGLDVKQHSLYQNKNMFMKCYEPLQKLRVRLGTCKTGLSPPVTLCY